VTVTVTVTLVAGITATVTTEREAESETRETAKHPTASETETETDAFVPLGPPSQTPTKQTAVKHKQTASASTAKPAFQGSRPLHPFVATLVTETETTDVFSTGASTENAIGSALDLAIGIETGSATETGVSATMIASGESARRSARDCTGLVVIRAEAGTSWTTVGEGRRGARLGA